jgi:hypothetical protein
MLVVAPPTRGLLHALCCRCQSVCQDMMASEAINPDKRQPLILSMLHVSCSVPQVSFLLPADHGLDLKTTWVGLVQHTTGCLQCLPARLSAFKSETLVAPSPLLLPTQHADTSSSSSNSNCSSASSSLGQQHACSTGAAAAGNSVVRNMHLQMVQLQETTTSYVATIQLNSLQEAPGDEGSAKAHSPNIIRATANSSSSSRGEPASASSSSGGTPVVCSGLGAQPVVMVTGAFAAAASGGPTHEIVLSLAKPAGVVAFRLRLLHPVQANSAGNRGRCGLFCIQYPGGKP